MIAKLLLPLGLAFIMLAIGLTLRFADFKAVAKRPKTLALGLAIQIIALPLLAFILLNIWPVSPTMAIGIMILAASPGGITSNLLTHFARGDTALSISLTAISSLAGMITVPIIVFGSITWFSSMAVPDALPVWKMALGVFIVSTLPVLIGMTINQLNENLAAKIERFARPASIAIFAAIVIATFAAQWTPMITSLPTIGPLIFTLNATIMALGYWLTIKTGSGPRPARAIALEAGLQNGALGIFVATTLIGNTTLAIPSITYALVMNVTAAVFILYLQMRSSPVRG